MAISDKTRKVLWGSSGNRCTTCRRELVISPTSADAESVVGQECHIISEKPNGPRYDRNYPAEKIDSVDNLILLCAVHHKMVDDHPETYTTQLLRTLKANHESWVRSSLAEEKGVSPLKLRRVKENIPSHLIRLKSGRDVFSIIGNSCAYQFDHPEPANAEEAGLIARFLQDVQDLGDISGDLDAGARVDAAYSLSRALAELKAAGFWVFGGREVQRLEGGISKESSAWPIAILEIHRATDPQITKVDLRRACSASKC